MPLLDRAPTPMVSRIEADFDAWATAPTPQGVVGTLLMNEARRVKRTWAAQSQHLQNYFDPGLLRLVPAASFEAHLRAYAVDHGIDLDNLIDAAAVHFRPTSVHRRAESLTDEELESLFEDDQHTFGG